MKQFMKNKGLLLLYGFLISFIFTTICSRSSFLYPMNNWDDANSFMTVAKGLMSGRVMYRDIFDQKGVYLYVLFMIAHFISNNSFFGVYVLEVIANTVTFLLMYRIMGLYINKERAVLCLPVIAGVTLSSESFYWGSSAEELFLPLLIGALYITLQYFKEEYPKPMNNKRVFLVGVFAGIIALIKYNILGFFFAWMMMVAFSRLLQKDIKGFFKQCGIFLAGMFLPFIPWIIYFAANHALYDWFEGYVLYNVTGYSHLEAKELSIGDRIYQLAKILYWVILKNIQYFIFIVVGFAWLLFCKSEKWIAKINIYLIAILLFLGIYIGGAELMYYPLPFIMFVPIGFAAIGKLFNGFSIKKIKIRSILMGILISCITIGSGVFAWNASMNTYFMKYEKDDLFLYQFKNIIGAENQNTLLNVSCLDAGLYTVCDIVPTCRWFQTQYIAKDEVSQEQERYIAEGLIDYVIAREFYPDCIWDKYELVGESTLDTPETHYTYYLFRNKQLK